MNKLCRQVSIESPGSALKDCVFSFIVPVPDTPEHGARVKVVCAGACYRRQRSPSISSISSVSSELNELIGCSGSSPQQHATSSPAHHGIRDGALFPGFEVAGVIEQLGSAYTPDSETNTFRVGQRVVLYPFDDVPNGYAEYIVVPEMKYLIPIPDELPLSVAAMLPTGALLAMNAVLVAQQIVSQLIDTRNGDVCRILIVGTGGLALWAVRIADHHFSRKDETSPVNITVASLRDEGFLLAKEFNKLAETLFVAYINKIN